MERERRFGVGCEEGTMPDRVADFRPRCQAEILAL